MPAFVVAALCRGASCPFKAVFDIVLRDSFNLVGIPWQRLRPEPLLVEVFKRLAIRKEPGLHDLDHEVALVVRCMSWAGPAVARLQVCPGVGGCDRGFGVDQKHGSTGIPRVR